MKHALLVTVRFHDGRYHGLDHRKASEWPPSPARLFQALMAGAACGASVSVKSQAALDWLEVLPPPVIATPRGVAGSAFVNFVPNNDLDAEISKGNEPDLDKAVARTRVGKRFRPTHFDSSIPILYCWYFDDGESQAKEICNAAMGLYQLGRGIDLAWAEASIIDPDEAEQRLLSHGGIVYRPMGNGSTQRELVCPQSGLRHDLTERFSGMRKRFRTGGSNRKPIHMFIQPPRPRLSKVVYGAPARRFVFELRPDDDQGSFAAQELRSAAKLVQEVRDEAATRLCEALPNLSDDIERYLIGRGAQDADKEARVRIVPVPSVGSKHADLAIRRLVIYVPQSCPIFADDLAWSFAQVAWADSDGVILKELRRSNDDRMAKRLERSSRRWRSLTPLVLRCALRRRIEPDRRSSQVKGAAERAGEEGRANTAVRQALRHVGIDTPVAKVQFQREPFHHRGQRADSFESCARFSKNMLWHADVTFTEPVAGPLLLGDGRFLGLGLMRQYEPIQGIIAFAITEGLSENALPETVALAARRAMMSRVQSCLPRGSKQLPSYVSGHEMDGSPAGDGTHRHIAVAADLLRRHVLYFAPSLLQRQGLRWREIEREHYRVERALEGMDVLRAGPAGRLVLVPAVIDQECDPLFAWAQVWESVTDYHVTRHHHRLSDEEALKADIIAELERRRWPLLSKDAIKVIAVRRGPRGGISGRLRLAFPTAQRGPLLVGRTSHKGGGLFTGI